MSLAAKGLALGLGSGLLLGINIYQAPARLKARGRTESVVRGPVVLRAKCSGALEARNAQVLRSELGGPVKVLAQEGAWVSKGQLLAEIDSTGLRNELLNEQENFASAQNDLAKAKRELKIQNDLLKLGAVPQKNVEDARAALEKAQAALGRLSRSLGEKGKKLSKTKIYSPLDGYLLKDYIKKAGFVSQEKEIVSVGTLDDFVARVLVDEMDIARVKIGQSAEVRVDAFPDAILTGRVSAIAPQAERETFAKIEATLDLMNIQKLPLKPNLSIEARIETGSIPDAVTVPLKALSRRAGRNYVRVLGRFGRLRSREVSVGEVSEDNVVVKTGLSAGETVSIPE